MKPINFEQKLLLVLEDAIEYVAAVGVVQCGDRFLLGLARNTGDDRSGKWVFPGGGIKRNEKTTKAAEREVWEETGIRCRAHGQPFQFGNKKHVAFVHCKARSGQTFKPNSEFTAVGFFTRREMRGLKLYHNVIQILDKI